jgi:hypothetical protein
MQEEERRRYIVLFDRGNEVFGRLKSDITYLNSRTMSFIGVNLVIISIILTLVLFWLEAGWQPSKVDIALLFILVDFLLISLVINILIFRPTGYKDLEIFRQQRFDELLRMDEKNLFSDFLSWLKEAYEDNFNKYIKRMRMFIIAFYSFIIANIILIIFLIKNSINWV